MSTFAELCGPVIVPDEKAPVVGGACRVEEVEMRLGIGGEVDVAATIVTAGHDGSDAHVEVSIGLSLTVHSSEAVNEAGDEEFAGAVDDLGVWGCFDKEARSDLGDLAVFDD